MRIGIDIDGVLTDEHNYIIDNATKFFYENNISYSVNKKIYDNHKLFNVSEEEYVMFWEKYFLDYINNISVRPYAVEVINKLKNEGHEIFIITARPFTTYENEYTKVMQNIVKDWLDRNDVIYDDLIFSEDKAPKCKELNISVMIEDKPENIISVSQVIPVICYDQPFNENISSNNIYRCYSWYDIYKELHKMNKDK